MAIHPKELRIGNYFQLLTSGKVRIPSGVYKRVTFLTSDGVQYFTPHIPTETYKYYDISPIILTPEILKQFGFERANSSMWRKDGVILFESPDGLLLQIANQIVSYNPIDYVHQLQNAYHAITGKDYPIDLIKDKAKI